MADWDVLSIVMICYWLPSLGLFIIWLAIARFSWFCYPNGMLSLTALNGRKIVNGDLVQSGKENVMACFSILSQQLFGNTEENHRTLRSDSLTYNASFNF